jgi:hypothetical protein
MPVQTVSESLQLGEACGRKVVGAFDGGALTSDAGAVLLSATDKAIGLVDRFARCFTDGRAAGRVVHDVRTLVGQRVFGLCLGYEDLIDHDHIRYDPVLGAILGKLEAGRSDCAPLSGKSTLNRLEHAPSGSHRYRKISHDPKAIEGLFVEMFLDGSRKPPKEIILDLDATDDPIHGRQEGRFFHGYYDSYCYLPLYIFCGRDLLCAKLRRSNIDGSAGSVEEIERIAAQIRRRWPRVKIILRADSGFAREALMSWCEANRVDYVFGLARNPRLEAEIADDLVEARKLSEATKAPARVFREFLWTTKDTWSRRRRVIAKAEWTRGERNPRFLVTSLKIDRIGAKALYEDLYCARGEMENRIKECQLDLFADRTSAATMRANQLRLWFASFAYVLLSALRRLALKHTIFETATCGTIRLKLLKIGARVTISVRRIKLAMASAFPWATEWRLALLRLNAAQAAPA